MERSWLMRGKNNDRKVVSYALVCSGPKERFFFFSSCQRNFVMALALLATSVALGVNTIKRWSIAKSTSGQKPRRYGQACDQITIHVVAGAYWDLGGQERNDATPIGREKSLRIIVVAIPKNRRNLTVDLDSRPRFEFPTLRLIFFLFLTRVSPALSDVVARRVQIAPHKLRPDPADGSAFREIFISPQARHLSRSPSFIACALARTIGNGLPPAASGLSNRSRRFECPSSPASARFP